MRTMTADADADADAPWQLQQQQQLPPQQQCNGKRWGVSTSKDLNGAGFGYVAGKQRPGNGGNNNRGSIVPAAGISICVSIRRRCCRHCRGGNLAVIVAASAAVAAALGGRRTCMIAS
jgi:hypothetical protein